ncbi:uncharacterized protein LOC109196856 [Oreochromis niloticus]|uniref:uncharacterized protein LOC109196856 n=1 Tax=Oreochromis niloticus TaxID=8128 RepID=UPI000905BD88|nr:uncharacterized protein LOC109196856 [Oreochromis niloticus]
MYIWGQRGGINEICAISKSLKIILFADDTNLLCCGSNLEQLLNELENELNNLKTWFDHNKLTLNLSKTKFIIFGNRTYSTNSKLTINNTELDRVSEIKFLGVIIHHKLSWIPHIIHIKGKISKSLAILYKVKDLINQTSLYTLYCSIILPYMTYCVEVWGNMYKTHTYPIYILQKRAIRIINKATSREPSNPLFIKLNILKFKDLVDLRTAQTMYKAANKSLPHNIQNLFQIRPNTHDLRGILMFSKPVVRTNVKYQSITVRGVSVWNTCTDEIKTSTSIQKFTRLFKNNKLHEYRKSSSQ